MCHGDAVSEIALEQQMPRGLGDLIQDRSVSKIADDVYGEGFTPDKLRTNWKQLLQVLSATNLCSFASKTVIAPISTRLFSVRYGLTDHLLPAHTGGS